MRNNRFLQAGIIILVALLLAFYDLPGQIQKQFFPYSTVVELTLKCNMDCIHCGSSAGNIREKELTVNEWKTVFSDLSGFEFSLAMTSLLFFTFTGN